jgi:hypothetical protein
LDEIFSFGGFYAFCFFYAAVMGAIMASSPGLDLFSREKRAKCTDFLMTKPITRGRLFFAKLLAALTLTVAANIPPKKACKQLTRRICLRYNVSRSIRPCFITKPASSISVDCGA